MTSRRQKGASHCTIERVKGQLCGLFAVFVCCHTVALSAKLHGRPPESSDEDSTASLSLWSKRFSRRMVAGRAQCRNFGILPHTSYS